MRTKEVIRTYKNASYEMHLVGGIPSRVTLAGHTKSPVELIAKTTRGYTGEYSNRIPAFGETSQMLDDVMKTKLKTPLEMLHFTWLIQGVTRAWTHQAVRYRVGTAYIQESMRFLGHKEVYEVLVPPAVIRDEHLLDHYGIAAFKGIASYEYLTTSGMEDQDARGTLPTNILTSLFWDMSFSTLQHIFDTRWCCQAQTTEWLPVMAQMRKELERANMRPLLELLIPPVNRGEDCGFSASFDRPCTWTKRSMTEQVQNVLTR
jgi:thymidylate synthase (FAD)